MILRFCLYGFLKNQRYFEPFLVLAFLDRGLSFLAYCASFALLAQARDAAWLALGMALYGVGDAFRSGTHKAMILTWLRAQGREAERTRVYGVTRSWSKLGSAAAVLLGAGWVLWRDDLAGLFWMALLPYAIGILNLATYPAALDGERASGSVSAGGVWRHLTGATRDIIASPALRSLLAESSGFMGTFKAVKDYLQPVLQTTATVGLVALLGQVEGEHRRVALLIGPVYFGLYLLSAYGSRQAARVVSRVEDEDAAARWLWWAFAGVFLGLLLASLLGWSWGLIAAFVALHILEALWRPIILGRFDAAGGEHQGATLLSIESQARSLTTMVLAPLLGWVVDMAVAAEQTPWWPLAAVGLAVGVGFAVRARPGLGGRDAGRAGGDRSQPPSPGRGA